MAYYNQHFSIVNRTNYSLILDRAGSEGLGDGEWPEKIAPNSTVPPFVQHGNFQIKVKALYIIASPAPQNIYMEFYVSAFGAGTVIMKLVFSPGPFISGSIIHETNSNTPQTQDKPDGNELYLRWSGLTNTVGTATFTVGG